jgi:hypothetical protein
VKSVHGTRVGCQASNVDDAASTGPNHQRRGRLGTQESTIQTNRQNLSPLFQRHFAQLGFGTDGGVVDQHIQSTPSLFDLVKHVLDLGLIAHIGNAQNRFAPNGGNCLDNLLALGHRLPNVHRDIKTVSSQGQGHRPTYVSACAGDQSNFLHQKILTWL